MLKITLTNPNTQATETYDVVKEFNPMFERAKELGLISSIFGLKVKDMKDENAPIRLHADSDVGNGLLRILPENDSLYDVRVTDESVSGVREELHDDLEANLVYEQYSDTEEMYDDIKEMLKALASSKLSFFCPLTGNINDHEGDYIAAGEYQFQEVYDGRNLPNQGVSTAYAFRLELAKPPSDGEDISEQPTEWLGLPVDRENADAVARRLGVDKIEDCVYLGFESSVPQIEGDHFGNMQDFNMLNSLADMMLQMSPSDQVKFKAVLSAEEPEKIEEILDVARNLRRYDLATQVDDPAQFFKSYLIRHMDKEVDPKWLDSLLLRNEGHELAERLGATFTDYGVVSARNRSLYEPIPRNNPIMDEKFDLIEVNGQQALFSNGMIKPENIPKGLYKYDLRGGEIGDFLTIEPIVRVNRSGTILVKEPFEFDGKDHIPLTGETSPNFLCEEVTPREFLNGDYEQAEAEEMDIKMGGI